MTEDNVIPKEDELPLDYQEVLRRFGKQCIEALKEEKFYFTKDEILKIVPDQKRNTHKNVIMGFLIKNTRSLDVTDCYQPLHKTFLEFVAAYYLMKLVLTEKDQSSFKQELQNLQEVDTNSLEQILLYTVELLGDEAHVVLKELGDVGLNGLFLIR